MTTQEVPNEAGMWWFTGVAIVPHSTSPGNETTVHIGTAHRFEIVETEYGLIPSEPNVHHLYPHVRFIGTWVKAYK